jgi:hypothetical protein
MSGKQRSTNYWDTCIFLAWIKDEKCWPEEIKKGIEQEIEQAYSNQLVIATSVITITEVLLSKMTKEQKDRYYNIFKHPSFQLIELTKPIAGKAAVIREFYDTRKYDPKTQECVSGSCMDMGDAIHLASALNFKEITVFKTLDGTSKRKRRLDILTLDGNVADARLSIKIPNYVPPPAPLKGPVKPTEGQQTVLPLELTNSEEREKDVSIETDKTDVKVEPSPIELRGSSDGHSQGQTASEASKPTEEESAARAKEAPVGSTKPDPSAEKAEGKEAGK